VVHLGDGLVGKHKHDLVGAEVDRATQLALGFQLLVVLNVIRVEIYSRFVRNAHHVVLQAFVLGVHLGRVEEAEDQRLCGVHLENLDDDGYCPLGQLVLEDVEVVPVLVVVDLLEDALVEKHIPDDAEVLLLEGVLLVEQLLVDQACVLVHLDQFLHLQFLLKLDRMHHFLLEALSLSLHLLLQF